MVDKRYPARGRRRGATDRAECRPFASASFGESYFARAANRRRKTGGASTRRARNYYKRSSSLYSARAANSRAREYVEKREEKKNTRAERKTSPSIFGNEKREIERQIDRERKRQRVDSCAVIDEQERGSLYIIYNANCVQIK